MIISVVVLMVATTYHCSAQPSIRFRQALRGSFGHRNQVWTQEKKEWGYDSETISGDELNQRIDLKDNFPLVETFDGCDLSSPILPERH
jgi:hypothetical protein